MLDVNRPVHTEEILSFNDYIQKTSEPSFSEDKDNQFKILYRGQEQDWQLLPKIGRPEYNKTYTEDYENGIINAFKKLSYPYLDSNFKYNDWDWLSLAQHYNVPTRLLDWTENPLIALWFAYNKKQINKSSRIVWRFLVRSNELADTTSGSPFELGNIGVFTPNHITKRITAQNSWFTAHYFSDEFKWRDPLEEEKEAKEKLTKMTILINEDLRNDILKRLDRMGINSSTVFPDLEGLGNYLQWKYSSVVYLKYG